MAEKTSRPIVESLQEYGRGVAGGLLFSLPLLYTMEVWWTGFIAGPMRLLVCTGVTFLLLLGYNRYAGMHPGTHLADVVIESIEELGLGLIVAAVVLFFLGRITWGMSHYEILGKIILEAMLVAIGVSVGTAQLGGAQEKDDEERPHDSTPQRQMVGQFVLAFCGAMLLAANIAPTEEIVVIAVESSAWKLIGLAVLSLLLGALILHYSSFHGAAQRWTTGGTVLKLLEPVASYAVALLASALLLWMFGRFDDVSLFTGVAETVVLGFAGTLGAAAGRLLIQ